MWLMKPVTLWICLVLVCLVGVAGTGEIADHVDRARAAQQRGDFVTAAAEWQALAQAEPNLAEAHSNAGMMLHFAHQYTKAIEAFRQAVRLNPQLVAPHLFMGIDYYLVSRAADAIRELEAALKLDSKNALGRKWLAMASFQAGDFFTAARVLNTAIREDHSDPELLFWLSRTYSKVLFVSYEQIRRINPESDLLRLLRDHNTPLPDRNRTVKASLESGRADAVFEMFERAIDQNPSNPENWFWLGKAAQVQALKMLDAFLAASPKSYRVHQLQAEHYIAQGDEASAISEYHKALAMQPDAVQLHSSIGGILMSRHEYKEAIIEYDAELRADPYSLAALERIGTAYAELHEPDRAEIYLRRALTINPRSYEARRAMGKISYERGDYKNAVSNFLAIVTDAGAREPSVLYQLSQAYGKLGNEAESRRWRAKFRQELANQRGAAQRRLEKSVTLEAKSPND